MPRSKPSVSIEFERHIAAQRSSGVSIARYCSLMGIAPHRFYYWKRKHLQRKSDTARSEAAGLNANHNREFIPVRISDIPQDPRRVSSRHASSRKIRIRLPNKAEMILPFDDSFNLEAVIRIVSALPC